MDSTVNTLQIYIDNISCINCCEKIERALLGTNGIIEVNVNYETKIAVITFDSDVIDKRKIYSAISDIGYEVSDTKSKKSSNLKRTAIIFLIIICLYILLQKFGILNYLAPSNLADSSMSYGMLFIIGIITSVHCIAMCGGINLSQSLPKNDRRKGKVSAFAPAVLYNVGRVISYTVMGCIMGSIGFLFGGNSDAAVPVLLQGILKLAAGVLMVIMGLNMLGIQPKLRKFMPRMPKSVTKKVNAEKAKHKQPFVVGLLNGFMPCGPLYSMHIVAISSASPLTGGLSMLMFSLGTVPLMLCFGTIVSALGSKFSKTMTIVGAVLVTVMGFAMLAQGGSLSNLINADMILIFIIAIFVVVLISAINFKKNLYKNIAVTAIVLAMGIALLNSNNIAILADSSNGENDVEIVNDIQVVKSTLMSGKYPDITVKSGIPVKWIIDAPEGTVNGCNYSIIIDDFNITYEFHSGENIIEFTPEKSGKYNYSCWMGMINGSITVV